jgi:hypothetical protein
MTTGVEETRSSFHQGGKVRFISFVVLSLLLNLSRCLAQDAQSNENLMQQAQHEYASKKLAAGTWEQLYECAIVELDHAQLPGRILDARHAILDRAEEILTRPSCDEHRALNTAFRTLRTLEEVIAKEKSAA